MPVTRRTATRNAEESAQLEISEPFTLEGVGVRVFRIVEVLAAELKATHLPSHASKLIGRKAIGPQRVAILQVATAIEYGGPFLMLKCPRM
jgi:hypothetical protein